MTTARRLWGFSAIISMHPFGQKRMDFLRRGKAAINAQERKSMSALGNWRTFCNVEPIVRFTLEADIHRCKWQVRQGPKADIGRAIRSPHRQRSIGRAVR